MKSSENANDSISGNITVCVYGGLVWVSAVIIHILVVVLSNRSTFVDFNLMKNNFYLKNKRDFFSNQNSIHQTIVKKKVSIVEMKKKKKFIGQFRILKSLQIV